MAEEGSGIKTGRKNRRPSIKVHVTEMAIGHGIHTGQRGLLHRDQLLRRDSVSLRSRQSGDPGDAGSRR